MQAIRPSLRLTVLQLHKRDPQCSQLPFLAKYDLNRGLVRAFVDGCMTYRHLFGGVDKLNAAGVTIGGGVAMKVLFLRLSREFRYTRFPSSDRPPSLLSASQNQADILVGLTFWPRAYLV